MYIVKSVKTNSKKAVELICQVCGKKCSATGNLNKHLRKYHGNETAVVANDLQDEETSPQPGPDQIEVEKIDPSDDTQPTK